MNKGNWGKIRAFFDLQTEDGFTLKGFKLVEGINGLFVGFPSQKGSDDEYHDTIWADRDVKEQVNQLAIKTYGQEVMAPSPVWIIMIFHHLRQRWQIHLLQNHFLMKMFHFKIR